VVTDNWMTKLSTNSATLDAGYAVLETRSFMAYPMVSLGVRQSHLHMEQRGDFSYDDALQDPSRGVTLSSMTGLVQASFTAEQRMSVRKLGRISLAATLGVARPFGGSNTIAGESRVSSTPSQTSGTYFRLSFGKPMGSRREVMGAFTAAMLSVIGR